MRWPPLVLVVVVVGCRGGGDPSAAEREALATAAQLLEGDCLAAVTEARRLMEEQAVRPPFVVNDCAFVLDDELAADVAGTGRRSACRARLDVTAEPPQPDEGPLLWDVGLVREGPAPTASS